MSTKEFDTKLAHDVVANYQCVAGGGWTERAASLLGPALDALSAARKERDEASASLERVLYGRVLPRANVEESPAVATIKDVRELEARWCRERDKIFQALASLAERVKAIEERMEYTGNE